MSLKNDFKIDIQNFMQNHVVLMPGSILSGSQRVSFKSEGEHTCLLINKKNGIKAHCLQPRPNERNRYQLTENNDYFFTPIMNGCQLAIYRLVDGQTWVEHQNDFDGRNTYRVYREQINQLHPAVCYIFTPDVNYDSGSGLMAIGQRTPQGWCLWIRYNVAADEGPVIAINVW